MTFPVPQLTAIQPEEPRDDETEFHRQRDHGNRPGLIPIFANERHQNPLHAQFPQRHEIRKVRILGVEIVTSPLLHQALERGLSINQRRDNRPRLGIAIFENRQVSIIDTGANHRIAPHLQPENTFAAAEAQRGHIDGNGPFLLLFRRLGETGRDAAIHRHVHDTLPAQLRNDRHRPCFTRLSLDHALFLQGTQVIDRRRLAGKTKMLLNLSRRGHYTRRGLHV